MNLSHLEYFATAYETGSISEAAKKVYVSQQSVSAAVAALERELHATLLTRSRSGVMPTTEGRIVYDATMRIFEVLDKMRTDIARGRCDITGKLSFAYIPEVFLSCGYAFEKETLDAFRKLWPGVEIEVFKGQLDFCENAVKQEFADLALVTGITDTTSFRVIPVWESPMMLYVHKDHELAKRKMVSFADLKGRTLLSPPNSGYPLWEMLSHCRSYGFSPQIVSTTNEESTPFFFKPEPDMVSFVFGGFLLNHYDEDYVAVPLIEEDRIIIPANVIVKAGVSVNPQTETFIEHLRYCFGRVDEVLAAQMS